MALAGLSVTLVEDFVRAVLSPAVGILSGDQSLGRIPRLSFGFCTPGTNAAGCCNVFAAVTPSAFTGTHDVDMTTLTDPYGGSVAFARLKLIVVLNPDTTEGHVLKWGPHPTTNGLDAVTGGVIAQRPVPNAILDASGTRVLAGRDLLAAPGLAGIVVDATHKVLRLDAGAATIAPTLLLAGCDA